MLRRNSISASAAAALAYESRANDPIVVSAVLATADRDRGTSARYACGIRVWRRTVVVYVRRRAMLPSQSLSQGVFFVGRFRDGYHVWQVVH